MQVAWRALPAWRDRNQGDPGITLLGLLAWLGAALLFALGLYAARRWQLWRRRRL